MAVRNYTWTNGSANRQWGDVGNWTGGGGGYPGNGGGDDNVTIPTGLDGCNQNTGGSITINNLTVEGNSGSDVALYEALIVTGNCVITTGHIHTRDWSFNVSGYTTVLGTLDTADSPCYFGYGNTTSPGWDLSIGATGVLVGGSGDWHIGNFGAIAGADITLPSGVVYVSGSLGGRTLFWSPDQGVGSWDNNNGTVILEKSGELRTRNVDPLTAADADICPFHTLIISGGHDRTDAPEIDLIRGLKVDNELIIKNGVLKWNTDTDMYGDVWVGTGGTQLTGAASQSAAIVMDDIPMRSKFVSHSGSSTADWGMVMAGNAIVSGATANIHLGTLSLQSDASNSALAANKTITGLNGSPYFHFPAGEACALFDGNDDYIDCGDINSSATYDNISVSAWFKCDAIPTGADYQVIASKWGVNEAAGRPWIMMLYDDNLYVSVNSNSKVCEGGTPVVDTWHHAAFTYDKDAGSNELLVYLDGVQVDACSYSTALVGTDRSVAIGAEKVGGGDTPAGFFDGNVADVRVYDFTLDSTAIAALAATNPATSLTGTYPLPAYDSDPELTTPNGGWWKLQPYQISDGNGSGDMDFTDYSGNGNDGTNNGTVPGWGSTNIYQRTAWISLRSYQRDLISNNTFGAGVEGRGSTMYIRPALDDLSVAVADSGAENSNTNYAAGLAFKFNNFNICAPSAGNGVVKSRSQNTGCGLLDITGDLFIASGSSLVQTAHSSISSREDEIVGDIYVSGNLITYGTLDMNDSTMVDALDAGDISRMAQLYAEDSIYMQGDGTYNATPYLTITRENPGISREDATTFTHNNGTYIYADKVDGGWGLGSSGWTGSNTFYNFIISGTNLYKSQALGVDNDMTLKNCTAADPNFKPYVQPTYVAGDVNVESGCAFGNYYIPSAPYNSAVYISGNLNLNGGDLYLSGDGGKAFHIYGSLFNRGGEIFDAEA